MIIRRTLLASFVASAVACGGTAHLPVSSGEGPQPTLPAPRRSLIPTINVARAVGWTQGASPVARAGTVVNAFAQGLQHPRSLLVLPNGDVLVAETNAPPSPDNTTGIKGWFFKRYQKKGGSGVSSANRIVLLRDGDGDGVAEQRHVLLSALHSPFGMTLIGRSLYIANTDAIVRFPYASGDTVIVAAPTTLIALPAGTINRHWTNRKPASGYKVIFVPFANGRPAGAPIDVLTGFLSAKGEARGRPVGVAIGVGGSLLVADDVGNTVWRVSAIGRQ